MNHHIDFPFSRPSESARLRSINDNRQEEPQEDKVEPTFVRRAHLFIKDNSGLFFDPAKASLIEVDKDDTGPIRNYRMEYPGGQSIRVKCNHEEMMWALSVVVPAAPDTKAERFTSIKVEWEGQVHYSVGSEGVFPVIVWRFRPDQPDLPEPVFLFDNETRQSKYHEEEDFDQYGFKVVAEQ